MISKLKRLISGKDKSSERYRNAFLTVLAGVVARGVSMGAQLYTVSVTYRYLGAERFGMWMVISSVVMMLGFADLGMGSGIINPVAEAIAHEDNSKAREAISSAFWTLFAVASGLILICLVIYPFADFARFFNVHSPVAVREAGPALLTFTIFYCAQLPLQIVRGAQTGIQRGFHNNLWNTSGAALSLAGVLLAVHFQMGLPVLLAAVVGIPWLCFLLNGIQLFVISRPQLFPNPRSFSRATATTLFKTGFLLLMLQISFTIALQSDNIVISQIMGSQAVATYAVVARLFNLIPSFLVLVSGSMWPAYADALARSDVAWIRKSFFRVSAGGGAVTVVTTLILVLFGNQILRIWVGPKIHASTPLLIAFGCQSLLYSYLQPLGFLLNGIGQFQPQVISAISMAVVNLGVSILLVMHFGVIGAVTGTVISFLVAQVIPLSILTSRALSNMSRECPAE